MSHQSSNNAGGWTVGIIIVGLALLITYWYLFLAAAVLGGAVWYYLRQKHAKEAAAAAAQAKQAEKVAQKKAFEGSKVDRIRQFKQLLDEGAITADEFAAQKAKILAEDDDEDELKF